jgi:diguanylate cyclase (GGDEF)-like protein/PAS domain S-box-containing protein
MDWRTTSTQITPADGGPFEQGRSPRRLPFGYLALIVAAGLAVLLTAAVQQIQSGATAYIVGENHWSKAQQDAVHYLYRYTQHGNPADLRRTREALGVPLGDRAARLALERQPSDDAVARAGFLQGQNEPEEVDRLIWMYKYFSTAPYFRDSVRYWRAGDIEILRIDALADEVERDLRRGPLDQARIDSYQQRLQKLADSLRPLELAFSQTLVHGSRMLRRLLLIGSAGMLLGIAWYAYVILRWTLRSIQDSEGKFRAAFHQAAVGMLKMDRLGNFVEANEALGDILGYRHEELLKKNLIDILHPDELAQVMSDPDGEIDWEARSVPADCRFLRRDGSTLWGRWTASVINLGKNSEDRIFAIIEDVSQARLLAGEMEHQASHDSLTGLINRREIERRLAQAIESARQVGVRHALCFVDLDQFKVINDTCGHEAGDELLRQLATTLSATLRDTDWLGRLGGDEFALLLEHTTVEGAERVAEKLNDVLAATAFIWMERSFSLTCSIGVVEITGDTPDVSWLLRAADTACYLAKDEGRNRIRTYHDTDEDVARRRGEMEWVSEIRKALKDDRLVLYAQRIEPVRGPEGLQYEILVRLKDTAGKIHGPGAFLPAAERYDQALAIDRRVMSMMFEQLAANPQHLQQLELCHVNLSGQSIADTDFHAYVIDLLDRSPIPASKLCFEITETAVIGNLDKARTFINEVRARGCMIALDDFGSGLSSFAYLKNLNIDILKIDGVFVVNMANDDVDHALVSSICEVGRALGKRTIAEWVETEQVFALLGEVGVEYVQGYAIHTPCPLEELIRMTCGRRAEVLDHLYEPTGSK